MFREGLGEHTEFAGYHPAVNLTYYVLVIGITMFCSSPWFLAVTFLLAWGYSLLLGGRSNLRLNLIFVFWILVVMALINVLFTHDGETVLFYLHGNRITEEALIYGLSAAVMLSAVLIWFTSFNVIMTAEKLIFIFGRAAPVLGLTLSMVFRYIPLLRQRYEEISMGQRCLGRGQLFEREDTAAVINNGREDAVDPYAENSGRQLAGRKQKKPPLPARLRQAGKNASILMTWSLESSIESADSMEARGYGLRGRTSFHLYRFTRRDAVMTAWFAFTGALSILGCVLGKTGAWFYPVYVVHPMDALTAMALAAFALLLATPLVMDVAGELRWGRQKMVMEEAGITENPIRE